MRLEFSFIWCYGSVSAALTIRNSTSPPTPQDEYQKPPLSKAGESADQYISQLFGPLDPSLANSSILSRSVSLHERGSSAAGQYREYYGIHELSWDNETAQNSFNLSIDFSNACTGLKLNDTVGLYTFADGTTKSKATLNDIVTDVWSLSPTPSDRRRRWLNHTNVLAEIALEEANTLLNSGMICENYTAAQVLALAASGHTAKTFNPVHDELRHLLASSAWSYWLATLVSVGISAGIGAGLTGGIQYAFTGNITAQNMVQTGSVVGATVFIGGLLMRNHEVGRIEGIVRGMNRRGVLGRQAVLQNAFIARWREVFEEIRRQSQDRNWEAATNGDLGGFDVEGQTNAGSTQAGEVSIPVTPGGQTGDQYTCLSDTSAAYAIRALGQMTSDETNLRMLSAIESTELERLMNGEAGNFGPDPSTPGSRSGAGASSDRGLCRNIDSSQPTSFRSMNVVAEASAQDLVEMANLAHIKVPESVTVSLDSDEAGSSGSGLEGDKGEGSSSGGGAGGGNGGADLANGDLGSGAGGIAPDDKGKGKVSWDSYYHD